MHRNWRGLAARRMMQFHSKLGVFAEEMHATNRVQCMISLLCLGFDADMRMSAKVKDRLIGDRRPRNAIESSMGVAKLPYAPCLWRLLIQKDQIAHVSFRGISDRFLRFSEWTPSVCTTNLLVQDCHDHGFGTLITKRWM